jgi:hypothetical protein
MTALEVLAAELAAAADPAAEIRYRQALAREAAEAQREQSWSQGYAAAIADVKRAEHDLVDYFHSMTPDAVRWAVRGEPRTRATFAQTHPGDYPGKGTA